MAFMFASACTVYCTSGPTAGYGNFSPVTNGGRGFFIIYALIGIPLTLIFLSLLSQILNNMADCLLRQVGKCTKKQWVKMVTFIIILFSGLVLFIFIPSLLFVRLQGWTYFESVYYCIVTLTTVGFGDLVPSQNRDSRQFQGLYRICASGWIWFGLAFVALVISQVQSLMEGLGDKCSTKCRECQAQCHNCRGTSPVQKTKPINETSL